MNWKTACVYVGVLVIVPIVIDCDCVCVCLCVCVCVLMERRGGREWKDSSLICFLLAKIT